MSLGVAIIGTAMTGFGPQPEETVRSLAEHVATGALADASLPAGAIDLVVFGNAAGGLYNGQEMIRGEVALRHTALAGTGVINVENACASSSSAFNVGCMAIRSGMAQRVLVIGAEKMVQDDKSRTYALLGSAVDLTAEPEIESMVRAQALGIAPNNHVLDRSPFMEIYADRTRQHLDATSATIHDVAAVSVKNRRHASMNPRAQFREPVDCETVLASRMIADPLRLLMCSPVADGAAAVVLAPADEAPVGSVDVLASEIRTGNDEAARSPVGEAAHAAYERSGVGPGDLDVLEIHDAAASAELWCYEELGIAAGGEGHLLVREGATSLGGRIPVNPSGGLLAKGHPIGATGTAQLVELAEQLRGRSGDRQVRDARVALAENGGGIIAGREAVAVVTILACRS